MTYNDAKFSLPPSVGSPGDFLDNLKRGYDTLWEEGATHPKMMSIGLHPRLIGQASRIHALREFLEYVQAKGGAGSPGASTLRAGGTTITPRSQSKAWVTCIRVRACTHQLASWPRPRWKRSAREAIQPAVSAVQPSIDFL